MGAKAVRPDAEVWIIYGDGSVGFSIAEFDTMARHKLGCIAVVGNDAGWTQIRRDQVKELHDDVACNLERTDYHTVVEGLGGRGFLVTKHDEVPGVLRRCKELARQGIPCLINAQISRTSFRDDSLSV